MEELINQVQRFKQWASKYSSNERYGEWECNYPNWIDLYRSVREFIATYPSIDEWPPELLDLVLYALARDNECQHIANQLCEDYPAALIQLAKLSIKLGESDAKWQLAQELGKLPSNKEKTETILIGLAHDSDEYVRRQALMSLAKIQSEFTESLVMKSWYQPNANQEWSRMAALWCLNKIDSPHFEELRLKAELDSRSYLSEYAKKARQKDFKL